MQYILRQIVHDSEQPIEIYITEDEVEIGRRSITHLSKFPQISRRHAIIYKSDDGSLFVKDLNSLNGCFVNDVKIGSCLKLLSLGDIIGFGVSCDQTGEGFVCVLCSNAPPAAVKHEVIVLSDSEEQEEFVNSNKSAENSQSQEPISESRSFLSEINANNILNTIIDNVQTVNSIVESTALKTCSVLLVKCDSKQFKWPHDVKNPFVKEYNEIAFSKRHKRVRKLSSDSSDEDDRKVALLDSRKGKPSDSDDETFSISVAFNKKHERNIFPSSELEAVNVKQEKSLRNEDCQINNSQIHDDLPEQGENRKFSTISKAFDGQPPCLHTNLESEMVTNYEFQNNNQDELNYSQNEEIIIISDDESYFDFKSSQTYVHIKAEPEDIGDNGDNVNEFDSLSHGSKVDIFTHPTVEAEDRFESIEAIQSFIDFTELKCTKDKSNAAENTDAPVRDFPTILSENFEDQSHNSVGSDVSFSVKHLSAGPSGVDSSEVNVYKEKNKSFEIGPSNVQNRDGNKTQMILIDPKPMKTDIRERTRGSRKKSSQKEKSSNSKEEKKKSSYSRGKTLVESGTIGFHSKLGTYKIPHKPKVDIPENPDSLEHVQTSKSVSKRWSPRTPIKRSPVKVRPDKFASRMGFLVNEVCVDPKKPGKPLNKEKIGKNINDRKTANPSSTKKHSTNDRNNSFTQNKSLHPVPSSKSAPFMSSNKSFTENTSAPVVVLNRLAENLDTTFNRSGIQNTTVPAVLSNMSVVPNIPQSIPLSNPAILPKVCSRTTPVFNPRDPRQNRTNKSVPLHDSNKLNVLPVHKGQIERKNTAPNCKIPEVWGRQNRTISNNHAISRDSRLSVITDLLQLNVLWLQEQATMKGPPPLVSQGAVDLPLSYDSHYSYTQSFYPMLILEIWEQMYAESKEVFASNKQCKKFYFSILSCTSKDLYVELKCESVVNEKVSFIPKEGNLVILGLKESSTKCVVGFGYINNCRSETLDLNYVNASHWKNLGKHWLTNAKHWTFNVFVKKRQMNYELNTLMKGNGLCYIKNKLRLADAMDYIKCSPLLPDILQPRWQSFLVNYAASSATSQYNSCQVEVINGICEEINKPQQEPKIVLLQGPPGTGKTHTIIGLIKHFLYSHSNNSKFKILVTAPSNAAVDEIGCRLIEVEKESFGRNNVKFVRVGLQEQVHMNMKPYFLNKKAEEAFRKDSQVASERKKKALEDLRSEISELERGFCTGERRKSLARLKEQYKLTSNSSSSQVYRDFFYKMKILRESHIILSTLSSCGLSSLTKAFQPNSDLQFTCCIIDECTQCTELEILQPFVLGISKLILVGDHEQLPATVLSKLACKYGFEKSAFERFHSYFIKFYKKTPMYTLSEQFRMHSAICEFPAKHFYSKKVITNPCTDLKYKTFPLHPYIFLDILISQESSDLSSKVNCSEASVIVNICSYLQGIVHSPSSIGIITPYQAQRSLYVNALYNNPWYRGIEVNTVDGFQGREKDVIILSSVRANSQSGSIGFLASRQRLNVAITRAKKCLIICAHAASLMQNPDWRALVLDAKERNVCIRVTATEDIPMLFREHMKKL